MILQELHDFALREELVGDLDFERKPIAYRITIGREGELLGMPCLKTLEEDPDGKKKPRQITPTLEMPRESSRTSGDRAFFLFDKAEYIFGLDPDGKRPAKKLEVRSALFRERVRHAFEATGDEALGAILAFLERVASGEESIALHEDTTSNDLFTFFYRTEPLPVTARPKIRAYWKELRGAEQSEQRTCLITGEERPAVDKHTTLKYIPGASTSGIPLVSFNNKAFESYGLKGNENALISREAAEIFAAGLQYLLHPAPIKPGGSGSSDKKQNWRLSADTTVVYWTSKKDEAISGFFGACLDSDTDEVTKLFRSPHVGRPVKIENPNRFYALVLSGAQGRAIIRSWFESTVSDVEQHLREHFEDLAIVRNTPKPKNRPLPPHLGLRTLLQSLTPPGRSETVPPALASQLLDAALRGRDTLYPMVILQRAIQRTRAEIGRDAWADFERRDARAALIKAVLNRKHRKLRTSSNTETLPEIKFEMDPQNTQPGYLLGRLMAVLERLQQTALGDVNASVIDRYFSAASATPRAVFVRLLKGSRHHARKARDEQKSKGFVISLEKQIDEILAHFDVGEEGIPRHLSLENQGLFVLGYHQQRHHLFQKKSNQDEEKGEV